MTVTISLHFTPGQRAQLPETERWMQLPSVWRDRARRQSFRMEIQMKTTFLLVGGLLCVSAWQANAADVGANASAGTPDTVANSQGPELSSGTTMSGGPAISQEKTRAEVYQDLIQSQRSGEAARLHELFKGGSQ
jgi:hypothetical protein